MTDLTSNTPMEQSHAPKRNAHKTEFMVYFAVIFIATLPLACLTWALAAFKSRSFTSKGPMARAWTQARIITPMIFSQ